MSTSERSAAYEAARSLFPGHDGSHYGIRGGSGGPWIITFLDQDNQVVGRAEVDADGNATALGDE